MTIAYYIAESKKNRERKTMIEKGFITLRIRRVETGLEIFVQSEKAEEFFKPRGVGNDYFGVPHYGYPFEKLSQAGNTLAYFSKASNTLLYEGYCNLSFLRAVGLGQGVTLVMPGVFSLDTITKFLESAKIALKVFYRQYLKPVDVELIISTREVD